jgi:hypothetical protein
LRCFKELFQWIGSRTHRQVPVHRKA